MDLVNLKKIWVKESKTNSFYVDTLVEQCKEELVAQGLLEDDPKFYPYLIVKVKKKLKIEANNVTLKRFKNFLKEN